MSKLVFINLVFYFLLTGGCSSIRSRLGIKEAQPRGEVFSLLDSLWRSPMPVDTVILEERPVAREWLEETQAEHRRGPASAEVGRVAKVWGYRVQLASSGKKGELESVFLRVQREFDKPAYIEKHSDCYCLRIGNFTNKAEAEALRARAVSYGYRHAWIVQTLVFPEQP